MYYDVSVRIRVCMRMNAAFMVLLSVVACCTLSVPHRLCRRYNTLAHIMNMLFGSARTTQT